jgi:uncharacterized membrane protein YdfJ with MMPL/SSD domain
VVKRPLLAFLLPLIVLVPLAVYGGGLSRDFDLLTDLSEDNEARVGFETLAEHLGAGEMQPLNVVVIDPAGYDTPEGLARVEELQTDLVATAHVSTVRSFSASLPDSATLSVSTQLGTITQSVRDGIGQLEAAFGETGTGTVTGAELQAATEQLVGVFGYLTQLSTAYPEVLRDSGYEAAAGALSALSEFVGVAATTSETAPGAVGEASPGTTTASNELVSQAVTELEALAAGLESLQASFADRPDAILLPDLYLNSDEGLKNLRDAYFSSDGTAARLQVVLDSGPYSPAAISAVQGIRQTLSDNGYDGAVEGNSAVLLDLRDSSDRDMSRAFIFVLGGVFVVLILLLRALVAPVYLILTILLSYAATLGVTRLLFVDILGGAGVTWWVPMFMFVMLVALGMDYNIFLIGRVKEEVAASGSREGTRRALARTGGIITSAGIIMAGTFASLASGSILGLLQIGFAVAFGVLLDTFVVRTTLVPAITVLLGRWAWWPRRGPGKRAKTAPR